MTATNGHTDGPATSQINAPSESASATGMFGAAAGAQFSAKKIEELMAELEVPFDAAVIEWRIINTTQGNGLIRGLVIPYADQRAYTDRLNALFSPAGWTRKYAIHTSANFQRGKDEKTVAKVFVSCELTIFGLGTHSATGEEWADNDNAGTSAEAQAFKRACSCFGLGRYLYHFTGAWVDLDDKRRLKSRPALTDWATPCGWRKGQRPRREMDQPSSESLGRPHRSHDGQNNLPPGKHDELVRRIEAMAEPLGRGIYRGLLKTVARAWKPSQIRDLTLLQKVLECMQSAERGLRRLEATVDETGSESLATVLRSLHLNSLDQVNDLDTLYKIVLALEAKAGP
ncbi:MAG TPA: Rad52/Rad22 family DNA repair protein [Terriglobales bacterium]|nr:Rad52/Rad22 family DNA repair protein [Terriglobales bacterium]